MYPEEVYKLGLPYELSIMISNYLAKIIIENRLEFPEIINYYYSKGVYKKRRHYDFSYDSDNDEYSHIAETSTIRWKVDETNDVKRYKIDQNPFI